MSNFTPTVQETIEFDGDSVVVTFKRLSRKAMFELTPFITSDGNVKDEAGMMAKASEFVPSHVVSIEGLTDSTGAAIDIQTVVDNAYFIELTSEIIVALFDSSKLVETDIKNSGAQLNTALEAQANLDNDLLQD